MRKRILRQLNRINNFLPSKAIRRQRFARKHNPKKRREQVYSTYSYKTSPKASRFNRWQDYKHLNSRYF